MTIELPTMLCGVGVFGALVLAGLYYELCSIAKDVKRFVDACDENERKARER